MPSSTLLPSNPDMELCRKSNYRLQAQLEPDHRQHVKIINPVKNIQYHHLTIPCGRIWRRRAREETQNVELYRKRCTFDKTELYHLLGFYSVFQGVVLGAVATSARSILACQTSLLPVLLSLLVSVATAISVHYKLRVCP